VVDPALKMLCCESCKVALVPRHVDAHIHKTHDCGHIRISQDRLKQACDKLEAALEMPNMLCPEKPLQYAGLALYDGIGCRHCSYACLSHETMRKHHQRCHPEMRTERHWPQVKVQQLDRQIHSSFFRVLPWNKPELVSDDLYLKNLDHKMDFEGLGDNLATDEEVNARQVSPWLLTTKWHMHVAGYDPGELKALVATPKKDELPGLSNAIKELFQMGKDAMKRCPELVLQRLNTPDPAKT
jgi:hypothetical protein